MACPRKIWRRAAYFTLWPPSAMAPYFVILPCIIIASMACGRYAQPCLSSERRMTAQAKLKQCRSRPRRSLFRRADTRVEPSGAMAWYAAQKGSINNEMRRPALAPARHRGDDLLRRSPAPAACSFRGRRRNRSREASIVIGCGVQWVSSRNRCTLKTTARDQRQQKCTCPADIDPASVDMLLMKRGTIARRHVPAINRCDIIETIEC